MVLRELLIKLGLSGGDQVGRELDKVDSKIKHVGDSFRALGGALALIGGVGVLKNIIDIGDHMQSLEFRLGQMQTSSNGGADAMANLADHATNARVSIEAYAEAYTGIGAATHELIHTQEDLLNVTDSVAMGLQLAGANTQQTTSVMQQLTQAVAVGKLQWEDMRVIMQNSDGFASRLAKSLGMTLNQMVKATQGQGGGIGADKIINALRNMSTQVKKEFASMPMTVGQAMQIIGNKWTSVIYKMNDQTHFINKIAEAFLYMADKAQYAIQVVSDSVGGMGNLAKLVGITLAAAFAPSVIFKFADALKWLLLTPGGRLLWLLTGLGLVAEDAFVWMKGGDSAIGRFIGSFKDLGKNFHIAIEQMRKEFWGLFGADSFEGLLDNLDKVLDSAGERIKQWGNSVWASLYSALPKWVQTILGGIGISAPSNSSSPSTQSSTTTSTPSGTSFADAAMAMQKAYGSTASGGMFSPNGLSYGQKPVVNNQYSPNITLNVTTQDTDPAGIKRIVSDAMRGHIREAQDRFNSNLIFNAGVNR